ncbi:11241_t:CDS:2, partial [Dentiscutata erythropus]
KKVAETTEEHKQELEQPVIAVNIEAAYPTGKNITTTSQSESGENVGANFNLHQESERLVILVNIEAAYLASKNLTSSSQSKDEISVELQSATTLSNYEKELLKKFCTKMMFSVHSAFWWNVLSLQR